MGRVQVAHSNEKHWLVRKDISVQVEDPSEDLIAAPDDLCNASRFLHPGGVQELQLFEVRIAPNAEVPSHAHFEDEIIYVTKGELRLGAQILRPGSSVYVPGDTLYSFRAGPEGLHFLNFRAAQDLSMLSKEELLAHQRAKRAKAAINDA